MKVAVVGGGINGIMSAWALARRGCQVVLFERDALMGATSSASTKLLHGGIRYLELGHLGLVREALRERQWWIEQAPQLAHPLRILIPLHHDSRRSRLKLRLGLSLYDLLAGRARLGPTRWMRLSDLSRQIPALKTARLRGAYAFYDGQMDDHALGLWAARRAAEAGVSLREKLAVDRVSTDGHLVTGTGTRLRFDRIVNVAGPWARALLATSGIASNFQLDLVRGSHILVDRALEEGVLLQVPGSQRIAFALPYLGKTLIGTTECRQALDAPIVCSEPERKVLIDLYNHYFHPPILETETLETFAGVRPLLKSHTDAVRATREYFLERHGALVSVFGGKWTTSRALGEKVADLALS